jgi:hypothetical protein
VGDVIGKAERNVIRVRVPVEAVAGAQRELQTLSAVRRVVNGAGQPGWLRVEVDDVDGQGDPLNNRILGALIRAAIPIVGFEPQKGRLQDVFLDLTTKALK